MAQICAWNLEFSDLDTFGEAFDKEFLVDVIKAFKTAASDLAVESNKRKIIAKNFYLKTG